MASQKIFIVALACSVLPLSAQQDAPPPRVDSVLRDLAAIEAKQKLTKSAAKAAILTRIQAASANGQTAEVFYINAVEEVHFRGRKDKVEAFQDWKKKNSENLRSKDMQTALLFHLRYLTLALQRKGLEKPESLLPATTAYLNDLIKEGPADQQGLLGKPLGQSVFAQWLQLAEWLPDDQTWESQPGDIAGILEKNIRPILRDSKSPQLLHTWDLQMKVEADAITSGRLAHKADIFNNVTRQRLIFLRAQDMIELGQPNRALGEMLVLVKTYPEHPDFQAWMTRIRELIKPPGSPAETSPQ